MYKLANKWKPSSRPKLSTLRPSQIGLRWRLTIWYTLSLGIILVLFVTFLYVQLRNNLISQVDVALQLATVQATINVNEEGGKLAFQNIGNISNESGNVNYDFVIHLRAPDGTIWDTLSNDDEIPTFPSPALGYHSVVADREPWRIFTQELTVGNSAGQIQIAKELEPVYETLENLQRQLLLGLPAALLLAGLGGYFLALRALRPINQITQTARLISANDLNQRIHYRGPQDEVGKLAATFDNMLDRLQATFERERRFTGDAAHELRTPLTALKGRIEVTLSRPRQSGVYTETLQEMEGQVDRLIRLSNDLLLTARLDQEQLQPQPVLIELDDFMAAVVDQVRPSAKAKSITLIESIPPGLTVRGDIDLLIRLFLNLLDNAVRYTPADGRVTISAERVNEQIHISIHDTGPGISAKHLPHLFERFYRVEAHRSRNWQDNGHGGAGLGLAIAYEIARIHGGHVLVQSKVGQGTTFIVQLL
jgi:heavy metal sensor kinase